ncbi:hypothetical protein [Streptomyces sp. NPDC012825]|uniref:hypothetical protein n=1 Tax=Streptomyces sp. NPDC012825 TaxID=3364851 RepID=UPI0036C668DF
MQDVIRAARTTVPAAPDGAPAEAGTTTVTEHRDQGEHDPAPPHAVDHPGRDAALTPKQRAEATRSHLQAAMPEEYVGGRTTDPATWLRTPENLTRLAKFTQEADARRRLFERAQADPDAGTEFPPPLPPTSASAQTPGPARTGDRCPDAEQEDANRPVRGRSRTSSRLGAGADRESGGSHPAREEPLPDLHEPLENYPDELPPPR